MTSYELTLLVLMIMMITTAIGQIYQSRISILGIASCAAGLSFVIITAMHGDLSMLSVILFLGGIALMVLELFVVGIVIGVAGAALVMVSFLLIGDDITKMAVMIAISLFIALIEWVILVKFFGKKVPLLRSVVLNDSTSKEAGYSSHDDRSFLIGQIAVTNTPLRPSGIITFEGDRIDAVSDGPFIDRNREVKIIHVEGTRVVVRENL